MSTLNLPQPVHNYAGQDELRTQPNGTHANGNGANGDVDDTDMGEYVPPKASDRLKAGMIYPPREIRGIIDKTANHISKSPTPLLLEEKIKEFQKTDPKFSFLNSEDPYHQYYRYMIEVIREGSDTPAVARATPLPVEVKEVVNAYEPKPLEFKVDLPGVTAMDLDILRLTALFHARRGRSFLSSLSVREGRNYQFDFLRPTHSLYGYYNRMVEAYIKILNPPPGLIESIVKEASDPEAKWKTLEEARNRAEWERGRRKREGEEAREKEEESKAFAAIDWQDFVVVETIEFTQQDVELDLPPPTSSEKLKSMSMAEKRMASMVMEETGAGPTGGDLGQPPGGAAQEEMEMEDEEEEEARLQRIKREQEQARAREVQKAAMAQKGVKIRSDYVPKGLQRTSTAAMQKCPYCGQMIAESELTEHIRIELLDPKWKEQKKQLEMRRTQAQQLQQGADVSASLRNLANARTDLFGDELDEEAKRKRDQEEKAKRKEREKLGWDGHVASAQKTTDTFQSQFNLDDQIKKMHSRIGLADEARPSQPTAGPQAGPGIAPQPLPAALAASLPTFDGKAYAGATISAAPTGPSQREYTSVSYDSSFAPPSSAPPSSAPSSGPSVHPSRLAQMGSGTPVAGQVHPREDEPPREKPVFKRPKIEKLPYGQLYSEIDWMSLHPDPITIAVQLPSMPEKPEWKLDGSIIAVPDLHVNTLFSTLRERIKRVVDADLPISRLRLDYNGKVMTNNASMASVNLDEDDMLVLSVRKK